MSMKNTKQGCRLGWKKFFRRCLWCLKFLMNIEEPKGSEEVRRWRVSRRTPPYSAGISTYAFLKTTEGYTKKSTN